MIAVSGSNITNPLRIFLMLTLLAAGMGYIIAEAGVTLAGIVAVLPFVIAFLYVVFNDPRTGLLFALHYSFIVNGLGRFLPASIPFGLFMDALLGITVIASIFRAGTKESGRIDNWVFYLMLLWFLFTLLQLVNPDAKSKEAWFYAVRGVSLYAVQAVPLILLWMNRRKDLDQFINIWIGWSLVAAFYGFKMQLFGVTGGERQWLDEGGKITHEIHGRLRIFSFYSDAGQFGAAMAHTALLCLILAIGPFSLKKKVFYWASFAVTFWAYALSGSRGPLFVLLAGAGMYFFLIGNFRILATGILLLAMSFVFLKYTHIGDSNYQIHRMRTALDPNDPSLLVRLENQKKLASFLATRPFGGGIGSGGSWGARFSPGSFLAEVALDSWYVRIWVETGIIGLLLHVAHILVITVVGVVKISRLHDPVLRQKIIAITCGFFGIAVASYGNQIFGQMPTGHICYFSMVYMFICTQLDKEQPEEEETT